MEVPRRQSIETAQPEDGRDVLMSVQGVSKRYGATQALRDADLEVHAGEILGLVGENGSGKSTLLRIMAAIEPPDSGSILFNGAPVQSRGLSWGMSQGIGMVFQELALLPNLRVFENLFLPAPHIAFRGGLLRSRRLRKACTEIVERYNLRFRADDFVGDLSFADRQLLEIVRAIELPPLLGAKRVVVLLDEATSALDAAEVARLFVLMRQRKTRESFVFVTHRISEAQEITERIAVLRDGKVVAKVKTASTSEAELHALMIGRERSLNYFHRGERYRPHAELALELVAVGGHGFSGVSLTVKRGEIVGIAGVEGSGKSELCEAVHGLRPITHGSLTTLGVKRSRASTYAQVARGVAYLPKERSFGGIIGGFSISRNVALHLLRSNPFVDVRLEHRKASEVIKSFGVKASGPNVVIDSLSGGNQQKVALGKWLIGDPKLLVLDNPTRGVDVGARSEIYASLRGAAASGAGVLIASDELNELIGFCDRIAVMKDGHLTAVVDAASSTLTDHEVEASIVRSMV